MKTKPLFDLSDNIQVHGAFVGVIFTLVSFLLLLFTFQLLQGTLGLIFENHRIPNEKTLNCIQVYMLAVTITYSFFAGLYWIGFVKQVRWCLAAVIVFLIVSLIVKSIVLFNAIIQMNSYSGSTMLIMLAINGYKLLVTCLLHTVNCKPNQGVSV